VEVSDPKDPKEGGSYITGGFTQGVHVLGDSIYAACGEEGFWVVNVSDPSHPEPLQIMIVLV